VVPGPLPRGAPGGALRRALQVAGAALLAAAVAFCTIPLGGASGGVPAVVHGRAASEAHGQGPLRAGAAKVRIPLGERPVIAGYSGHRRASGSGEEVFVRALAIEAGGARALIATIDTLLIPGELEEEILRRANLGPKTCLMLAASHTHSGPGGAWNNFLAGWAGSGAFDRAQRDDLAQAAAEALMLASGLTGPAEMAVAREEWPGGPARPRSEGPVDPALVAVELRRFDGEDVAALIGYAMHPTTVPRGELRISGDWPARAETHLLEGPALVLQGAVGNATWDGADPARPVALEALRILDGAKALREISLACETRIIALPRARASRQVPWLFRRAVSNVLALGLDKHAVQTRIRAGPLSLLGVPGEPVGELGLGARPDVLVSLADGYFGYVETPERWERGEGESAKTYFGPGLARALGLWPR
jgi:hypothetical protein